MRQKRRAGVWGLGSGLSGAKWGFWCELGNHEVVPVGHSSMTEVNKFLDHLSWKHRVILGGTMMHIPIAYS